MKFSRVPREPGKDTLVAGLYVFIQDAAIRGGPCVACRDRTRWRLHDATNTYICSHECLSRWEVSRLPDVPAPATDDPVSAPSRYTAGETNTFPTGAVRSKDADGTRYDLISPIGLRRLAETYAEGAAKYGAGNWLKGFPLTDTLNHLMRHIEMFRQGDTSEDHLAHAAWGLFKLMHFEETQPELDDRPFKRGDK